MPLSTFLIIVGLVLFSAGIAKLSTGHGSAFDLNNFGFDIFRIDAQNLAIHDVQAPKTDWASLAAAAIGLLSAGIGITIAIFDWLKF